MLARGIGTKSVHHKLLKRAIETVKPGSVLEVGSGWGINLFGRAGYFPGIHFSGVELTKHGVLAAKSIGKTSSIPKDIVEFAQDYLVDVMAHQRVNYLQGSAMELSFSDTASMCYTRCWH